MGISSSGLGNALFAIAPVFIIIVFIFVFCIIIVRLIKSAKQWKRNNESPILTVEATVVVKRTDVHYYQHNAGTNNMQYVSSSTTYYATFQVSSGDRMEFEIRDTEYGMLVKNDKGRLTFQGTRYLGFERNKN